MALIHGKQLKDNSLALSKIFASAIVTESESISSNDNDTTLPTSAAVKDYVDSQVALSGTMSSFDITDGTTTETISNGNTITLLGTSNEIEVAVSATDTITIGLPDDVVIAGNLTVNGTTTTINSTTLSVDDKNIELGSVATPSDTTADGGGITLKGSTDKTLNWVDSTDSWTSSEHMDLASTKVFKIATVEVLSADGAAKVQSAVAGNGLSHTAGILAAKGLTVAHHDVNAAITSGDVITVGSPSANLAYPSLVGSLELKVNGIAYQQDVDWSVTVGSTIQWDSTDFDLDSTDDITLVYHTL